VGAASRWLVTPARRSIGSAKACTNLSLGPFTRPRLAGRLRSAVRRRRAQNGFYDAIMSAARPVERSVDAATFQRPSHLRDHARCAGLIVVRPRHEIRQRITQVLGTPRFLHGATVCVRPEGTATTISVGGRRRHERNHTRTGRDLGTVAREGSACGDAGIGIPLPLPLLAPCAAAAACARSTWRWRMKQIIGQRMTQLFRWVGPLAVVGSA